MRQSEAPWLSVRKWNFISSVSALTSGLKPTPFVVSSEYGMSVCFKGLVWTQHWKPDQVGGGYADAVWTCLGGVAGYNTLCLRLNRILAYSHFKDKTSSLL